MDQPTTIGLDLAKNVFQVHGVDTEGAVVCRRQLRRSQVLVFFARLGPCLVGMEACAGAHHWARELAGLGHEVRLMPPAYVKPYVKRGKTDAVDAEAICEAVTRPTMRFVPVKSADRQAALLDHVAPKVRLRRNARDFLVRQRTQIVNAIRAHLCEFGPCGPWLGRNPPPEGFVRASPQPSSSVVAKGIHNVDRLVDAARDVPDPAPPALDMLADQLCDTQARIEEVTARISEMQAEDTLARRLATVPGVGTISSSAFAATTPDVAAFRSARDYAAWLGLTPQAHSSGGKERLGRISKAGNRSLRRLLYLGASCHRHASGVTAQIGVRRGRREVASGQAPDWLDRMLARKPVKVVAIALANRMARTIWALIRRGDSYRTTAA